jgi:elongation factor Ts
VSKNVEFTNVLSNLVRSALETTNLNQTDFQTKNQSLVQDLVTKVGENIQIGRVASIIAKSDETIGSYIHNATDNAGTMGSIGTIVAIKKNDKNIVDDLAMHIAAMAPKWISRDLVPQEAIDKEKAIIMEEILSKHPDKKDMIEKMVSGKLNKWYQEVCLYEQPWVLENKQTVDKAIGKIVSSFVRAKINE